MTPGNTEKKIELIFYLVGMLKESPWEGYGNLKLLRDGDVSVNTKNASTLRTKIEKKISNSDTLNLIENLS